MTLGVKVERRPEKHVFRVAAALPQIEALQPRCPCPGVIQPARPSCAFVPSPHQLTSPPPIPLTTYSSPPPRRALSLLARRPRSLGSFGYNRSGVVRLG